MSDDYDDDKDGDGLKAVKYLVRVYGLLCVGSAVAVATFFGLFLLAIVGFGCLITILSVIKQN